MRASAQLSSHETPQVFPGLDVGKSNHWAYHSRKRNQGKRLGQATIALAHRRLGVL